MTKLRLLCATTALFAPGIAMAQTTGTVEAENEGEVLVVTGTRINNVEGISIPDTTKPRAVLEQEAIARQRPGQTILDTINLLPGVSFQNNDPYGSSGGTLTIRGFDSSRISLTFDGVPLNDSGNYAIYSNQQVDPELIDTVNVSLGTTDVDSPTASAAGGTVAYRTRVPMEEFGVRFSASIGEFNFRRVFGSIDTGALGPWGTRFFIAASRSQNDAPFNNFGTIDKQQVNARIYQPLGNNGDFVSLSGHYNQNRNNFLGSVPLRLDTVQANGQPRLAGGNSFDRFPLTRDERFLTVNAYCPSDTPQPGVGDTPASYSVRGNTLVCGSTFDERFNPSNTGNVRFNSRFTLSEQMLFTLDATYQYVLANGGGTATAREFGFDINPAGGAANCATTANSATVTCRPGYVGGQPYAGGRDLNGDGDTLDQVLVLAPSNTNTNRFTSSASLIYDINDQHRLRLAYTFDFAEHRQTGEVSLLDANSFPTDFFGRDNPVTDISGAPLQKRDRLSYAVLHQISAEYRGKFFDDRLTVNIGARVPYFTRDLTQNCFTTSAGGFVDCFSTNAAVRAEYATLNPTVVSSGVTLPRQGPRNVVYDFNEILPNLGLLFDVTPTVSVFANYAKGISVPSTDNLYNSLFFAVAVPPRSEITDSFDLGVRMRSGRLQAQLAGWYTIFNDRTASAYDVELNETVFRNLGRVDKMGVDFSLGYEPMENMLLYVFGSYMDSNIEDDIATGEQVINGQTITYFADTSGRRESGSADWLLGARVQGSLGPLELGVQAKYTGERYVYDTNEPVRAIVAGQTVQLFPATTDAYTLVDVDARLDLAQLFNMERFEGTYLQLNVTNLFDVLYVGGFGGGLSQTITRNAAGVTTGYGAPPFVQVGSPRTISASLVVQF